MESKWRQNVADYGWMSSQYVKMARGKPSTPGKHWWFWQSHDHITWFTDVLDPGPVGTEAPAIFGIGNHWPIPGWGMEPDHPPG